MPGSSFINHRYSDACFGVTSDPKPDCGHDGCGLLCDVAMAQWRQVNTTSADYHLAPAQGDHGRAAIQALLDEGRTLLEVATHLGVHPRHVTYAVVRGEHQAVLEAEALLRGGAMLRTAVAKQTGLSEGAVERLRQAIGVPAVIFERIDATETDRVAELRGQGWSIRAIAGEVGITKSAVERRLAKACLGRSEPVSTLSA